MSKDIPNEKLPKVAVKEMRERDAALAMKEYQEEKRATAAKTERLRALRLAKEANEAASPKPGRSKRR
jgi:hypothetical protein